MPTSFLGVSALPPAIINHLNNTLFKLLSYFIKKYQGTH